MSFVTEILLASLYSLLFFYIIYKLKYFSDTNIRKTYFTGLFIIKLFSGFALLLVYTYYYKDRLNSDVYKYFDDSYYMYNALYSNPLDYFKMLTGIGDGGEYFKSMYYSKMEFWYKEWDYNLFNDNRTIIRLNAFFRLFSLGSIYVHTVFMVFLSYIGLLNIYKLFSNKINTNRYLLITLIFMLPGVLFWTSGVLKEGLLIFAFGLMLYKFNKLLKKTSFWNLTIFIISILILSITKFYILLAATPGLIALIWISKTNYKKIILKFLIVHIIIFGIALNSKYVLFVLHKKQIDFVASLEGETVGSFFEIPYLEPNAVSLLKNTPVAIYNTFFRPYIFESNSIVMLLSAFENLMILLLISISLVFNRFKRIENPHWFYFSIFFTLIVYALAGLVTPVMGALVRYKVPALPFLMIACLYILDYNKLKEKAVRIFKK